MMDLALLPEILEKYRVEPFTWGQLDCCLFAANVIRDMTGHDYAEDLRGTYDTQFGAARVLHRYGGLEELVDHFLGPSQAPSLARRGDVVLGEVPEPTVGICVGHKAVFKSDGGLESLPLDLCIRSWKCPKH
jgi:hypothetical protein